MKVAIVANTRKEGIKTVLPKCVEELREHGIETVLEDDLKPVLGDGYTYCGREELLDGVDFIISFGGDGTILQTARISAGTGIPILGVNLGKVGFLAETSPEEILSIPGKLSSGDYEIIERMAFLARINSGQNYFALNDIVIDRNADTRILDLCISIDGVHAGDFAADGVIVSTPTGSTAHSVSAGGPLVMPECQVTIITPICPHSLTLRPMIIDGTREVCISVNNGVARMAVDGQSFIVVPAGCEVYVTRDAALVKIVRFTDRTYFDILHTRLRWGVSPKLTNA